MSNQPQDNGATRIPPDNSTFNRQEQALRPTEIERGERLLYRLTEFGRLLWESGIDVGPHQLLELAETLTYIDITKRDDFYTALKCSLLTRHEQEPIFHQLFEYFWFLRDQRKPDDNGKKARGNKREERQLRLPPAERKRLAEHLSNRDPAKEQRESSRMAERHHLKQDDTERDDEDTGKPQGEAYSAIERLRQKDFEQFSWEEIQEAKKLMEVMHWHLGLRSTRRTRPARRGSSLDMRRVMRRNLKHGAEMIDLAWREIRQKPRPLVIICDISGSMSLYSRLFLHFIHTISNGLLNVEAFVFGTRLTRITHQLKKRDVDDAVRDVSKSVQDWSGGTRIGDALHYFNYTWARRVLGRGAVVLLISDGWDRGESDTLRTEMDRLQHSCHRLIWLNPLLGSPDYRPLTVGMKSALPYIDDFLPVHNLDSLIHLGNVLASINDRRPDRSAGARRKAVAAWSKPRR